MMRMLGAVLAGGRSSRFGSDKAAALFHDQPLADHAATAIAPHVETVIRVGGGQGIADLPRPGLGPLGGLAGALDHAYRYGFDGVLSIACDMPVVSGILIEALLRRMPSYCTEAPVLGAWPVGSLAAALELLSAHGAAKQVEDRADNSKDGPSLRFFARAIGAIPVAAVSALPNVNTREDLLLL